MDDEKMNDVQQDQGSVVSTAGEGAPIPTDEGSMSVFTPESDSPQPIPQQPKKSKTPIVIGAVVVVAAVAAGAAYLSLNSPQKIVERAAVNTITAISQRESVFKYFGGEEIDALVKEGAYSIDQSLGIINMPGNEQINGAGISIDLQQDINTKQAAIQAAVDYNGVSLDALQAYTDDENIIFGSPMLYDGIFQVSTDNIAGQIKNSPVFSAYADGLELDEDFSLRIFDNIEKNQAASEELMTAYVQNWSELYQSMTFEKAESKEVDGVSCKGYAVTIPSAAADVYMDSMVDDIMTNEAVRDELEKQAELYYISGGYSSAQEYMDEIDKQMNTFKQDIVVGDITGTVYINKGIIVDSDMNVTFTNADSQMDYNLTGGYKEDNGLDLALDITYAGETVSLEYSDNITKDSTVKENYTIALVAQDNKVSASLDSDYDSASGNLNATIGVFENDANMGKVDISGSLVNSGNSFDLDLTDISVTGAEGQSIIDLSYDLVFGPLAEGGIVKPEGEPVKILEISQDEWNDIYSQIQSGLFGLVMQLQ